MWFLLPTTRVVLGALLATISGVGLLLNLLTLVPVFRLAFVLRKNQVYVIAFFNICSDVVQLSLATFYLAPAIIAHSFLVADQKKERWTLVLGSMFMFCWYFETVTQLVMAVNRFVVICLQRHTLFSFANTLLIFCLLLPACFTAMYTSQYTNPCCSFVFDQEIMGWSYVEIRGVHNFSNDLDLPLNVTSSVVSALCYILIFICIHKNTPNEHKARRKRDIRYAIQFSVILLFYMFVWILFRLLPEIIDEEHVEWFFLIPLFFSINCSSNAVIYLSFNCEVQNNTFPLGLRKFLVSQLKTSPDVHYAPSSSHRVSAVPCSLVQSSQVPIWNTRRTQPFRHIRMQNAL